MTTKDLIREKIDTLYTEYKDKFHQNGDSYHLGIIDGLDMAERILDTLPDGPVTDCHDLEEAAEKSARQYYVDGGYSPFPNTEMASHIAGFIAGAEWGSEHLAGVRKMMSEGLEEAAMNYIAPIENEDGLNVINFSGQDVADAFEAGAEWQKKQFEKKES